MEPILNYLVEKWPIFAMLVISVIVTAIVVWIISKWYHRFVKVEKKVDVLPCEKQDELQHRIVKVEEKVDVLPCEEHEELHHRVVKMEDKIEELPCEKHDDLYHRIVKNEETVNNLPCSKHEEIHKDIKEELIAIRTFLVTKFPMNEDALSRKNSPRKLNEDGLKLFHDIKGEELLNQNKELFFKIIDKNNPKTAFDVEIHAVTAILMHLDDDMFIRIKKWVYNSPTRKVLVDGIEKDYDIAMSDICFVLSLPLRDMYLELHPELQ